MIQFTQQPTGERFADSQREIDRRFPAGRFVAVEDGVVIADAESHRQLVKKLAALGKSPRNMLILQAGTEYPAGGVIFATASACQTHA